MVVLVEQADRPVTFIGAALVAVLVQRVKMQVRFLVQQQLARLAVQVSLLQYRGHP